MRDVNSFPHSRCNQFPGALYAFASSGLDIGQILPFLIPDERIAVQKVEIIESHCRKPPCYPVLSHLFAITLIWREPGHETRAARDFDSRRRRVGSPSL